MITYSLQSDSNLIHLHPFVLLLYEYETGWKGPKDLIRFLKRFSWATGHFTDVRSLARLLSNLNVSVTSNVPNILSTILWTHLFEWLSRNVHFLSPFTYEREVYLPTQKITSFFQKFSTLVTVVLKKRTQTHWKLHRGHLLLVLYWHRMRKHSEIHDCYE